jgi:GT2 family glycosyltransferase
MTILASIIIPFYDCFDLVMARLAEFSALGISDEYEVILVDDGSVEDRTHMLVQQACKMFPRKFRVVGYDSNLGFSHANNYGAENARSDVLCFLSSDVQIKLPFWSQLCVSKREILGGRCLVGNTGWNTFALDSGEKITFPYVEGWCVACTMQSFYEIGKWDEQYSPFDYEDIDFSTAAREQGYKLDEIPNVYFRHAAGGTIGRKSQDRLSVTYRNKAKFQAKWITSGRYKRIP